MSLERTASAQGHGHRTLREARPAVLAGQLLDAAVGGHVGWFDDPFPPQSNVDHKHRKGFTQPLHPLGYPPMNVLGLLEPPLLDSLTSALSGHGVSLRSAQGRPDAVLAVLGSLHDEDARRAATQAHVPVVWIVGSEELANGDSRLPANAHFVVHPVQPEELAARLRRAVELEAVTRVDLGDRVIDLDTRQVTAGEVATGLTATEARLLRVLVAAESRVLSRAELLRRVWGYRGGTSTRALDVAVRRLRTKIEPDPSSPKHLLTVVRTGYRLALTAEQIERGGRLAELGHTLRPDEVPVSDTPFYGRSTEQAALLRLLAPPGARVSLIAPPGMGKKRLALETLAQHPAPVWSVQVPLDSDDLPGAVLRVSGLGARRTLTDALQALANTPQAVLWMIGHQAAQASCRALLDQINQIAPQARVLYTGPRPLGLPGEKALSLGPLSKEGSCQLLAALWERHAPFAEPLPPHDPGAAALHELAGGLPLALELLGAGFATRSPEEVARSWNHTSAWRQLNDLLAPMWTGLAPEVQLGLMGLCQLSGSVSPEGAEHVLSVLLGDAASGVLDRLVRQALIQRRASVHGTRLWIPQPLVAFVRQVETPHDPRRAQAAVNAWCTHLGKRQTLRELRSPTGSGWLIELRTRAPDLEKAVRSEALNGRQTLCAMRALFCLAVYDASARPLDTLLEQLDPKLEFEPVERAELEYLVLEYSLGHRPIPPPERLNSALVSAQEAGHTNLEASLRICAGYLALGAADTALATVHAEAALALIDRVTPWNRVNILGFAVGPRVATSERPEVQRALLRHMRERREAGDHLTVARNACWVAQPHWRAGRLHEALDATSAGVEAARALTDHVAEARDLGNVATLHFLMDDVPKALEAQERALALMRQLGMRQGLSTDLSVYAELLHVVGETERSRQHTREALTAARTEILPRYRWIAWRSAVKLHLARGEWRSATAASKDGIAACGDPDGVMALELRLLTALSHAHAGTLRPKAPGFKTAHTVYASLSDQNARLRLSGMLALLESMTDAPERPWTERYAKARERFVRTPRRDVMAFDRLLEAFPNDQTLDLL